MDPWLFFNGNLLNVKNPNTLTMCDECVLLETTVPTIWLLSNYIEDITRWREDMNFIFEWQNNILGALVRKILFLP